MKKMLIAVPVFNEEKYVVQVLSEIRKHGHDVLVIDDGSTDGTAGLLRRVGGIRIMTHPENRGYGQSLIDAFGHAGERGYDWVLTMDCDEQHEPARIPDFYREVQRDDADVISGSRYLNVDSDSDAPPPDRRNINRAITDLLNATLGLELTDSFCGFKAQRVAAMRKLRLTIPGYAFPMQFWVQAAAQGLRIREIPVKLIYKDATRHFGGILDDPTARMQHYLAVLTEELGAVRENAAGAASLSECALCCDR